MLPTDSFIKNCISFKTIFEGLSDPIRNHTYYITSIPGTDTDFCVSLGSLDSVFHSVFHMVGDFPAYFHFCGSEKVVFINSR